MASPSSSEPPSRTLQELELNLTGGVSRDQAAKVGKLVGAKILVTGSIFPIDKQVMIVAKLVGTETSLVEGVVATADKNADIAPLVLELSGKIAQRLREKVKLVAGPEEEDPLPALEKKLAGRALPKVAVRVTERHVAGVHPSAGVDPAAETELRMLFRECGFTVIDGNEKDLAEAGVALMVDGQAFSEFAARIGENLVSCIVRVELKVSDRKTNEILLIDRQTARAVDLSENIAGKTALQKAARTLGIRMLQRWADGLRPVVPPIKPK